MYIVLLYKFIDERGGGMADKIRSWVASAGAFLAVAGIASIILNFINYNLKILMWIDNWGDTMGWVIRGGLVVGGGVLYLVGSLGAASDDEDDDGE